MQNMFASPCNSSSILSETQFQLVPHQRAVVYICTYQKDKKKLSMAIASLASSHSALSLCQWALGI